LDVAAVVTGQLGEWWGWWLWVFDYDQFEAEAEQEWIKLSCERSGIRWGY